VIDARQETRIEALEERLTRGAAVLFDREQRGETGEEYDRWLRGWLDLLEEYEQLAA
jgi:hypothetical protein